MKRQRRSTRPLRFRGRRNRHGRAVYRKRWERSEALWAGARIVATEGSQTQTLFRSVASFIATADGSVVELRGVDTNGQLVRERLSKALAPSSIDAWDDGPAACGVFERGAE